MLFDPQFGTAMPHLRFSAASRGHTVTNPAISQPSSVVDAKFQKDKIIKTSWHYPACCKQQARTRLNHQKGLQHKDRCAWKTQKFTN